MGKGVHQHAVRLAASPQHGFFFGLPHLYPHPFTAGEIGDGHIGVIWVRQARTKRQDRVALTQVLHLMGVHGEGDKPHHHALVSLAGMPRQSQRMVGVIAMVDVGDLQLRLVDGRFDGHGR